MNWDEAKPVLQAVYALLDADDDGDGIAQPAVYSALNVPLNDPRTKKTLSRLYEAGYIAGMTVDADPAPIFIQETEKGLQQVAGWPTPGGGGDIVTVLLAVLDQRIADDATPPEDKNRLQRIRDNVGDLTKDVAVGILSSYVATVSGIGG